MKYTQQQLKHMAKVALGSGKLPLLVVTLMSRTGMSKEQIIYKLEEMAA